MGRYCETMLSGRLTQSLIRVLDWLAVRVLPHGPGPVHQQTGRRGEEDAYFYLRRRGYVMIAHNYRSPSPWRSRSGRLARPRALFYRNEDAHFARHQAGPGRGRL